MLFRSLSDTWSCLSKLPRQQSQTNYLFIVLKCSEFRDSDLELSSPIEAYQPISYGKGTGLHILSITFGLQSEKQLESDAVVENVPISAETVRLDRIAQR